MSDEGEAKSVLLILNGHAKFKILVYRNGIVNRTIHNESWDSIELIEGGSDE